MQIGDFVFQNEHSLTWVEPRMGRPSPPTNQGTHRFWLGTVVEPSDDPWQCMIQPIPALGYDGDVELALLLQQNRSLLTTGLKVLIAYGEHAETAGKVVDIRPHGTAVNVTIIEDLPPAPTSIRPSSDNAVRDVLVTTLAECLCPLPD